jgi:hypothetical protein
MAGGLVLGDMQTSSRRNYMQRQARDLAFEITHTYINAAMSPVDSLARAEQPTQPT